MRARLAIYGLLMLVAAMAVAAVSCGGGGGGGGGPSGTPVAGGGIPGDLSHLVQSAQSGNVIELAALAGYQRVACGKGGSDPAAPACRPNESSGTKVEVLGYSNCDRSWVRPEDVPGIYRMLLPSGQVALYAVYTPNDTSNSFDGGFGAQYVVVLSTNKRSDGETDGVALHVRNGRVTYIEHECGKLADLAGASRVDSFLVAPGPSGTPASGVTPSATR